MLSIAELLNPLEPVTSSADQSQPSPKQHRFGSSFHSSISRHSDERPRLDVRRRGPSPPAVQGTVHFPPFEDVSDGVLREIRRYRISQFGRIHRSCEHIPYNSSKRDFCTKTGREYIEAFKYTFQIPGQTSVYTVMWDYTIGLVRITPFFKSLGYTKTKPSQALDKNPGLRDVCPSITGGSVLAQGYWMPFQCAKALCATFCHEISGALIPIFGPDFPSRCTLPTSPRFADMIISQELIAEAARRAPRGEDRPDTDVGGNDAANFHLPGRGPATPRVARSSPSTTPFHTASRRTRRSYLDARATTTTPERLGDTKGASHGMSHTSRTTSWGPETRVAAGEVQPDCEECEGSCGAGVAGPSVFHSPPAHKRLLQHQHHDTTSGERKRRKLVDDPSLTTEATHQHRERSTLGRRALPQSRGLAAASRRRESKEIAREEDNPERPATSVLVPAETGSERQGRKASRSPDDACQGIIQRGRDDVV
ncbi:hypothetical protein E4U54_003505 [Claviceps lovelessii]|nr:hypothetical protein E4U54_003505 [Claviceps lovelessii]